MPALQTVYDEYRAQGRIDESRPWGDYGGGRVVFRHPTMSEEEMVARNAEVMRKGYSMGRIIRRTLKAVRYRPAVSTAAASFFTQLGIRKAYRALYAHAPARSG